LSDVVQQRSASVTTDKYNDGDDEVFADITQIYNFKSRGGKRQNLMFKYAADSAKKSGSTTEVRSDSVTAENEPDNTSDMNHNRRKSTGRIRKRIDYASLVRRPTMQGIAEDGENDDPGASTPSKNRRRSVVNEKNSQRTPSVTNKEHKNKVAMIQEEDEGGRRSSGRRRQRVDYASLAGGKYSIQNVATTTTAATQEEETHPEKQSDDESEDDDDEDDESTSKESKSFGASHSNNKISLSSRGTELYFEAHGKKNKEISAESLKTSNNTLKKLKNEKLTPDQLRQALKEHKQQPNTQVLLKAQPKSKRGS
jgi:hypothetical protein